MSNVYLTVRGEQVEGHFASWSSDSTKKYSSDASLYVMGSTDSFVLRQFAPSPIWQQVCSVECDDIHWVLNSLMNKYS